MKNNINNNNTTNNNNIYKFKYNLKKSQPKKATTVSKRQNNLLSALSKLGLGLGEALCRKKGAGTHTAKEVFFVDKTRNVAYF